MNVVFTDANSKLEKLAQVPELRTWLQNGRKIKAFNLLSGYSCPQAKECLAKVQATPNPEKKSGLNLKVIDGKDCNSAASLLPTKRRIRAFTYHARKILTH